MSENSRMHNETREVFLARLLLSVIDELGKGKGVDVSSLRLALTDDISSCVRQGRARPERLR